MNLKKIKILGVVIITILSFISHFAYDIFPNIIFSFIFPVNESIWEHMKILFTSTLIYSLIEYILLKKYNITYNNLPFNTYFIPLMQIPLYLVIYIPLYKLLGESFSKIAKENNMTVQTCAEEETLEEYGFIKEECLSHTLAYKLTGKSYKNWTSRGSKYCRCVNMVDIGVYNSCRHFCKYCYANYDENKVIENYHNHDVNSPLLIGNIEDNDIIKRRYK